ncbi:MAG: ABC transporter ATP-binding protein, partial [Candidatus Nitrosocosmicus sp.]
ALGKMKDVSGKEGRTVLFVSHNMGAISTLCDKVMVLQNGKLSFNGATKNGLEYYFGSQKNLKSLLDLKEALQKKEDENFKLLDFVITQDGSDNLEFLSSKDITVEFKYEIKKSVLGLRLGFDLLEKSSDITIFRTFHDDSQNEMSIIEKGIYVSKVIIAKDLLKEGIYILNVAIGIHNVRWIMYEDCRIELSITNVGGVNKLFSDNRPGILMPRLLWVTK